MSAGRRLAKRSIIGTKVCAPGPDGLWYSGVIQDVKTPNSAAATPSSESGSVCADNKYLVRFDFKTQAMQVDAGPSAAPVAAKSVIMEARRAVAVAAASVHISPAQTLRRNAMIKEFRESDLIGPGFRSMVGVQLQPGQRVFFTFNGRETSGDVVLHEADKDEVTVKITAIGTEDPIELKKRLEEVRLLESRRSARLADQDRDTDFARLADMAGDRRRTSHSIDVPAALALQPTSRKRGPSYVHEDSDSFQFGNDEEMDECNAALILMKLSNSPKSPKNGDKWLGSSPGSSSASWSSGSSSPPLSEEDGQTTPHSNSILRMDAAASARIRTTSVSTSDEGIVMDYNEDAAPRKRRANKPTFKCIWKGCDFIEHTSKKIERHIRNAHLGNKKARRSADYDGSFSESDHEEEFYYTEIEDDDDDGKVPSPPPPSQPTLSHRDMARPPHEDPEYQRQIVGNFKQGRAAHSQAINGQVPHTNRSGNKSLNHVHQSHVGSVGPQQPQMQLQHHNAACMPTSPLAHHNYTWPSTASVAVPSPATAALTAVPQQHSPVSIMKHARCSPRPSATTAPYRPYVAHHHNNHHHQQQQYSSNSSSSISSNGSSGGGDSNNTSPHLHNNNSASANSVLQQLSQQNVTVTTHQSGDGQQQQQQLHGHQQHPLSAVTITPNYQHHVTHQTTQPQQHMRHSHHQQSQQQQQQSTTTASNIVANVAAPNHHGHSPHQHHTASHTHSTHQQQQHQQQHVAVQHAAAATRQAPNSPNRRTRGENKKCRKVYGMDRRDQWCTQCKWKKACSRFGD